MEPQIAAAASQLPQGFRVQSLTPSLSVEYHADNKLVLVQKNPDGTEHREPTSAMIIDAMYDLKKRSAMSSLSEISGFTGTAPAGPIKEEDEVDYSSARQFLQSFRQKARYWRDNQDRGNDRKLRVEREVPFSTRLERQPYYALLDLLSNHTPALYESTSFQTDLNGLQIWSPEGGDEELLAQVVYLPFQGECLLLVQPRLLQLLNTDFGKYFNDRMMATLILLQAITNASTHSTSLAKFHHSSTFDYSNVSPEQAFHMFPYVIECHGLDAALDAARTPGFH